MSAWKMKNIKNDRCYGEVMKSKIMLESDICWRIDMEWL